MFKILFIGEEKEGERVRGELQRRGLVCHLGKGEEDLEEGVVEMRPDLLILDIEKDFFPSGSLMRLKEQGGDTKLLRKAFREEERR